MSDADGKPGRAAGEPGTSQDERAELEHLRAEVAELRSQQARRGRHGLGWRTPVTTVLIVVGCVLAPVSVVAVWSPNQVSDTSRYVANVEPLVHNPAIQNALTDKITAQVTSRLNVSGLTDQAAALLTSKGLPRVGTLLQTFALSLAGAVAGFIHSTVHKIVISPQFARAWVQANTVAHQQLVGALSGQGSSLSVKNGQVVMGLAPFIDVVKQDLVKRGFTLVSKLPAINQTVTLFSAKYLVKAQSAYRLANDLKIVLPILTLLLIGLGVYAARGHRRALTGAGLGFAASMLLLGAALLIFRGIYLNKVPSSKLPADAAAALFDTLVKFIKEALRTLLAAGLVVAAGAFLTRPSVTAVRTRAAFASAFAWVRASAEHRGLSTGPVSPWTLRAPHSAAYFSRGARRPDIRVLGSAHCPVVIPLAIILLVVPGLIELTGRPPARPETAAQP